MQNEMNTAAFQRRRDLRQSLKHEPVVPCVGVRIIVHQPEAHQQGLAVPVGPARGVFQCGIVFRPLTLLHPVQDVFALLTRWEVVQSTDSGLFDFRDSHA